jgi:hypothetical protein
VRAKGYSRAGVIQAVTELLLDAAAAEASTARVQLSACGFGAGSPLVFGGSLLLPVGVRLSDYCNLDDPILLLQAARPDGPPQRFALAKDTLDAIWTMQLQPASTQRPVVEVSPLQVHIQTRLLDIVGTLHVAPGADPFEMLMRGTRRLVAVTGARIRIPGAKPRLDTGIGLCLVNRAHIVAAEAAPPRPSGS